jgi:hypothetical protein
MKSNIVQVSLFTILLFLNGCGATSDDNNPSSIDSTIINNENNHTTDTTVDINDTIVDINDTTVDTNNSDTTLDNEDNTKPNVQLVYEKVQDNLALKYATATQPPKNRYPYYQDPSNAIDGDVSTYNHTECNSKRNYLQLEFPFEAKIDKIVVDSRDSSYPRIENAKVYISNQPYKNDFSNLIDVATLKKTKEPQPFSFTPELQAKYILIKASENNCLHLSEVEVYGEIPKNPVIRLKKDTFLIKYNTPKNTKIVSLNAIDYQNDKLTYSIDGNVPFKIDQNGNILVFGKLIDDSYKFDAIVSDGDTFAKKTITINISPKDALEKALNNGIADRVTLDDLYDNVISELNLDTTVFKDSDRENIKALYEHLKNKDYKLGWEKCKKSRNSTVAEDYGSKYSICIDVPGLNEYTSALKAIRTALNSLDSLGLNIFETTKENHYRLQKLMILTGDKLRENIKYPMDKVKTDDNEFIAALLADYSVYNNRKINKVQKDLGNFSRTDFSGVKHVNKTVKLKSKWVFRSAGVYAFAGETFKVTRKDNSDVNIKIFINTLREGSTHEYNQDGYKRPKKVQSTRYELKPNQTIELTSCYGGPIEIYSNKNGEDIELDFENVGLHPYWGSDADNKTFKEALEKGEFDWAEISTAGFEVHSTLEKMRETVSKWGGAQRVAYLTQKYTSNYPHVLAGFKGEGVDEVPEILDFASDHNLEVRNINIIKHMNADQATCGYGCSGNPYDAYWAFNVIGHGDIHELGHGLESSDLRFEHFAGHAVTNPYAYYTQSRYNDDYNASFECQGLPFDEFYEKLQEAQKQSNPKEYMAKYWSQGSPKLGYEILVTIEAMMQVQKKQKLDSGWHLLARMHILQRERRGAKKDATSWSNMKDNIGFGTYSLNEFRNIPKNDYIVVTMSFAAELDLRPYFDMMGIEYSDKASNQINSFGYDKAEKIYFVSTQSGYCKEDKFGYMLDKISIPVDSTTIYPDTTEN